MELYDLPESFLNKDRKQVTICHNCNSIPR